MFLRTGAVVSAPHGKPKTPSTVTVSRRSVIDWLGKASVLALGAEALAACGVVANASDGGAIGDGEAGPLPFPDASGDASSFDGGIVDSSMDSALVDSGGEGGLGGEFPFEPGPGQHPVFDSWGERTVDRQDLASILASWRFRIDGMVAEPVEMGFAELVGQRRLDLLMDFHCVEGWSVHDVPWNGVHIATLHDLVDVATEATHITFHTVGGRYNESLPLDIALEPHTLLAYGVGGNTIPLSHGFPLRLVVPRLLAYKSAKYVERIELTDHPVNGFWVAAGYDYTGEVAAGRLREGRY